MLVSSLAAEVNLFIWGWIYHFIQLKMIQILLHFIDEINRLLAKDFGSSFELVYPQLVLTVKWKID